MGDYMNVSHQVDPFWNPNEEAQNMNYYENDFNQFQNEQLELKSMDDYGDSSYNNYTSVMYNPASYDPNQKEPDEFEDEPPLLEELEIYPDRILQKVIAVLHPLRGHSVTDDSEYLTKDADLAGPISFYIMLALCLFLSGKQAHFGYIYGISMISSVFMYALLSLMTPVSGIFTLGTVASILGYCLIPVLGLSVVELFLNLPNLVAILLSAVAVLWASVSASRLFVAVSGDKEQQPLIAYPCALVYGVYVLLVVF